VFSVQLNYDHVVIDHLDIFASSGFGIAHDELVPFSIRKNKLYVNDESSSFDGILHVEFVKVYLEPLCLRTRLSLIGERDNVRVMCMCLYVCVMQISSQVCCSRIVDYTAFICCSFERTTPRLIECKQFWDVR